MKRILLLFLLIVIFPASSSTQDSMKIVYFNNFAPYCWEKDGQMQGILVDVFNEALQNRLKIPLSHTGYPWTRAQNMVKANKADAFATVPTPERRTYTNISTEPAVVGAFSLFIKKGDPKTDEFKKIINIPDMKRFKLGNYLGNGWAKTNLEGMEVDWAPTLDQTLSKLAKGRFEIFAGNTQVGNYTIKKMGLNNKISGIPVAFDAPAFHLCVGKESQYSNILSQFDTVMKQLRDEGKLKEIYNKYN